MEIEDGFGPHAKNASLFIWLLRIDYIGMEKNRSIMVLRKEQAELFHMQRINSGPLLFIAEGSLTTD